MTRTPTPVLACLLLTLGVSACASDRDLPSQMSMAALPTEQFSIEVRPHPSEVRLALHREGLSGSQQAALAELATRWRTQSAGTVTIQAPAQADGPAAASTSEAARNALVQFGVPASRIQMLRYANAQDVQPAVIVGFASYQAVGPQCGGSFEDLAHRTSNATSENFGCAVTANFAAQIANPGDLINPRTMTPADASRRSVVLRKYREGQVTSTARDEQANGTLSTAVGGN